MKKRILLADDDESVRKMVARVLESAGYSAVMAGSSEEVEQTFRQTRPDLLLLDLSIPNEEGWEALGRIHQGEHEIPMVVMTAWPDQATYASRHGVGALLEKPLDLSVLLETILALLESAHPHPVIP